MVVCEGGGIDVFEVVRLSGGRLGGCGRGKRERGRAVRGGV